MKSRTPSVSQDILIDYYNDVVDRINQLISSTKYKSNAPLETEVVDFYKRLPRLNANGICFGLMLDWFLHLSEGLNSDAYLRKLHTFMDQLERLEKSLTTDDFKPDDPNTMALLSSLAYIGSLYESQKYDLQVMTTKKKPVMKGNYILNNNFKRLNSLYQEVSTTNIHDVLPQILYPGRVYYISIYNAYNRGHAIGLYYHPNKKSIEVLEPNDNTPTQLFNTDKDGLNKLTSYIVNAGKRFTQQKSFDIEIDEHTFQPDEINLIGNIERDLYLLEQYIVTNIDIPIEIKNFFADAIDDYFHGQIPLTFMLEFTYHLLKNNAKLFQDFALLDTFEQNCLLLNDNMSLIRKYTDDEKNNVLHTSFLYQKYPLIVAFCSDIALLNEQNIDGATPLHTAAQQAANPNILRMMMFSGAKQIKDAQNNTPLLLAARDRNYDLVEVLAEPIVINESNDFGQTALTYLINQKAMPQIAYLLTKGATVSVENFRNAIENQDQDILFLLLPKVSNSVLQELTIQEKILIVNLFMNTPDIFQDKQLKITLVKVFADIIAAIESHALNESTLQEIKSLPQFYACAAQLGAEQAYKKLIEIYNITPNKEIWSLIVAVKNSELKETLQTIIDKSPENSPHSNLFTPSFSSMELKTIQDILSLMATPETSNPNNARENYLKIAAMLSQLSFESKSPGQKKVVDEYLKDDLWNMLSQHNKDL